jgi:hypothetical protein
LPSIVRIEPSGRLAKVPAIGVAAVLLMRMKVVPIGSWLAIFPSTVTVAPPLMVTPFSDDFVGLGVVAVCLEVIDRSRRPEM